MGRFSNYVAKLEKQEHERTHPPVKIIKVRGNREAEKTIAKWEKDGYRLTDIDSRKAVWNPLTGFFTNTGIHTLTFRRT